jgi:hypothetical protein
MYTGSAHPAATGFGFAMTNPIGTAERAHNARSGAIFRLQRTAGGTASPSRNITPERAIGARLRRRFPSLLGDAC